MEDDWYKNDKSLLFSTDSHLGTTNGKKNTNLVTVSKQDITGFKQLNSTHVVFVVSKKHCVKLLDRINNGVTTIAGTCGWGGYREGKVGTGRLASPSHVAINSENSQSIFITDRVNNAIRAVDLNSGVLRTVIKSGFNFPTSFIATGKKLLVVNKHYISQVTWSTEGVVSNIKIAGSTKSGYVDGNLSDSRFDYPKAITSLSSNLHLVADFWNKALRLLDLNKKVVGPVCTNGQEYCVKSTPLPYHCWSLQTSGAEVYAGIHGQIHLLTGMFIYIIILS